jgi:ADP-ribose pyrophosphatase
MPITAWKKIAEVPYNAGYRHMLRRTYELPDGRVVNYDIKNEGRSVCILALTPENNVVLVRQFRPGPEKILLELPGGAIENDETPEVAIRRELLEETGYIGDIQFVGSSFCCAYSTRGSYNFVATNCRRIQEPTPDEFEFIEVVEMSLEEFKTHLRSGELTDVAAGLLGLMHLGLIA